MEALDPKELPDNGSWTQIDKIIQNVPAENSTSNLFTPWSQASNDLQFEFDNLRRMNLE